MSAIDDALKMVRKMTSAITVFKTPYDAGYNCGATGPTEINCHPMFFSSPELTKEWERGKRDGEGKGETS